MSVEWLIPFQPPVTAPPPIALFEAVGSPVPVPNFGWSPDWLPPVPEQPVVLLQEFCQPFPTEFAIFPYIDISSRPAELTAVPFHWATAQAIVAFAPQPANFIVSVAPDHVCDLSLGTMMNLVAERLDDPGFVYYTQGEVKHALNFGQRLFSLLTLCIERTVSFVTVGGQAFYEIDDQISDFLVPLRVSHSGTRLRNETIHNMDLRDGAWRTRVGNPRRYAIEGVAPGLLAITPRPAGASSLTFVYAACPAEMATESDLPEIPTEQHPHLVDFAYWFCRLKEGGAEFAAAGMYLQRFLAATSKYAGFTRARSRAQSYDSIPYDLATFDKSRFEIKIKQLQVMQKKKQEGA